MTSSLASSTGSTHSHAPCFACSLGFPVACQTRWLHLQLLVVYGYKRLRSDPFEPIFTIVLLQHIAHHLQLVQALCRGTIATRAPYHEPTKVNCPLCSWETFSSMAVPSALSKKATVLSGHKAQNTKLTQPACPRYAEVLVLKLDLPHWNSMEHYIQGFMAVHGSWHGWQSHSKYFKQYFYVFCI